MTAFYLDNRADKHGDCPIRVATRAHAARRTFICYALTKGIPPQIVMKFTGHNDYKAMKPYIDIAGADAAAAMQLMNE